MAVLTGVEYCIYAGHAVQLDLVSCFHVVNSCVKPTFGDFVFDEIEEIRDQLVLRHRRRLVAVFSPGVNMKGRLIEKNIPAVLLAKKPAEVSVAVSCADGLKNDSLLRQLSRILPPSKVIVSDVGNFPYIRAEDLGAEYYFICEPHMLPFGDFEIKLCSLDMSLAPEAIIFGTEASVSAGIGAYVLSRSCLQKLLSRRCAVDKAASSVIRIRDVNISRNTSLHGQPVVEYTVPMLDLRLYSKDRIIC